MNTLDVVTTDQDISVEDTILLDLTPMQRTFVQSYVSCLDGTKAAQEAGYSNPYLDSWRQLKKEKIRSAIVSILHSHALEKSETLQILGEIAKSDIATLFDSNTDLIAAIRTGSRIKGNTRVVKKITVTPDGTVSIEMHDKLRALEILSRHLGILDKKEPNTGGTSIVINQIEVNPVSQPIPSLPSTIDITPTLIDTHAHAHTHAREGTQVEPVDTEQLEGREQEEA